jgi:hypothetical protein
MVTIMSRLVRNRRGISLILSYALLISITVALSIGVYSWLRFYVSPGDDVDCPDGVKLSIQSYECLYNGFNLVVKNKGTHILGGFRLAVHDRPGAELALYVIDEEGVDLAPGEDFDYNYNYSSYGEKEITGITLIEVSPFLVKNNKKVLCENEVTAREVSCSVGDGL